MTKKRIEGVYHIALKWALFVGPFRINLVIRSDLVVMMSPIKGPNGQGRSYFFSYQVFVVTLFRTKVHLFET
jgi:hypothetical protein